MKKLGATILFSLFCIYLLSAQSNIDEYNTYDPYKTDHDHDWSIGIGINGVYDAGDNGGDLSNLGKKWNFGTPFYLSAKYYLNNQFSFGSIVSFNKYMEGKIIDGQTILKNNEASYLAIDVKAMYSFRDLLNLDDMEPYIFSGFGITYMGEYKTVEGNQLMPAKNYMTFNTGWGGNFWFNEKMGINLNITGKFRIGNVGSNQIQAKAGLLYRLI